MPRGTSHTRYHFILLSIFLVVFVWSVVNPKDLFTWFLEVFPAVIGLGIVLFTYRRFPLTNLVYTLITIHAIILCIGGHYTYAEMPLFSWLRDEFHLARNYYDRLGHFAQGFVPAIVARELLIRLGVVVKRGWLFFIVTCICLAISATYEFIEWGVAVATGEKADAFLGTQGDVWDTQWDMFTALWGAAIGLLTMSRIHDRQLRSPRFDPTERLIL